MRHRTSIVVGAIAATVLLAAPLRAQQGDSVTFRRGQWGAEFTGGSDFTSLGVLRLLSPSHALVLDGALAFNSSTTKSGANAQEGDSDSFSIQVRLGSRWYRPVVPTVKQFATIGVFAGGSSGSNDSAVGTIDVNEKTVGAFANLGAVWFPAQRLSLGASWEANTAYVHRKVNAATASESTTSGVAGRLFLGRLAVALYF